MLGIRAELNESMLFFISVEPKVWFGLFPYQLSQAILETHARVLAGLNQKGEDGIQLAPLTVGLHADCAVTSRCVTASFY